MKFIEVRSNNFKILTLVLYYPMFKVICGCALAYVLSLSLALSFTTIVSRHLCSTPVGRSSTSTPSPPCLATDTACRFDPPTVAPSANTPCPPCCLTAESTFRFDPPGGPFSKNSPRLPCPKSETGSRFDPPAVIRTPPADMKVIVSLAGKEMTWTRTALGWQEINKQAVRGKSTKEEIRRVVDTGVGHAWSRLKCDDDCFRHVFSSKLSVKSTNPTARSDAKTRSYGPGTSHSLFRLLFLPTFHSITTSLKSVVHLHRKGVLSSFTRDQLACRLHSSNTNRSCLCIDNEFSLR